MTTTKKGAWTIIVNLKLYSYICLILLVAVSANAQAPAAAQNSTKPPETIEGHWQGALVREGAVQNIVVDFIKDAAVLKAQMQTPDLVTAEPPPVPVMHANDRVQLETPFGKATLTIDFPMGEMIGLVDDTKPPISIHLKRAFKPATIGMRTEDVQFRNGDVTLAGTLVTPQTTGPHPAVVWIHGRGKAARNGFRGWARILAQRGVASLIYDKRGVGASTGDHDKSGLHDFAADALAALDFLASRREIDRQQIGLHGTSAGGWVAAIVASRTKIPLAFIITNVGPADSVRDQQIHVTEYSMRQSGVNFSVDEYAAAMAHEGLVQDFAYTGKGWEALRESVEKAKSTRWARFVDLPETQTYADIVWVQLNQYDPGPDLKKIRVPYLALFGGSDHVVPPEENVGKLTRYLTDAGNRDFKIVTFHGADHGLTIPSQVRRFGADQPEKYYWLWRKRAPGVVETTIDWLLQHVKVRP